MDHAWTVVTVRLDGRATVERCDSCGITVTRIHAKSPAVSQRPCTLGGAGADRSTKP